MPLHTLHTAAWNWPQPERVWPERWTSVDATGAPKNGAGTDGLNSAFLPWGAACPSTSVSEVQVGCSLEYWSGVLMHMYICCSMHARQMCKLLTLG